MDQLAELRQREHINSEITKVNGGYRVHVRVSRLKHGSTEMLPPFLIILLYSESRSLVLQCHMSCGELTEVAERDLAVIVAR